ncbi:MAG: transposase [Pirellulaceae bacterium]
MTPRRRRVEPGYIYHVLNRGAQRQRLFLSQNDYAEFESLIQETISRTPLSILSYELMPNHWHFVVKPDDQDQLSGFFQYVSGTHGKRFRAAHRTTGEGHVYQDRFKSFPVQSDGHFLTVCRYVERNALRAKLVCRAEDWRWSALWRRHHGRDHWLTSDWPVPRPHDWTDRVNQALTANELAALHNSVRRGAPLGAPGWAREAADQLDLGHTLRSRGRPRIVTALR